jgi:predicted SprT family Zn-dependent metalloprotease
MAVARLGSRKSRRPASVDCPTMEYHTFTEAFDYFNRELFGSALPHCLITLQRKTGSGGYFSDKRFETRDEQAETDEIALNPATFKHATDEWILSVLVHEMAHCWQAHYGSPTRNGYHNKEWANRMEELGLMPSNTGQHGGKRTGQRMSHYILPGGLFDLQAKKLLLAGFKLTWQSRERKQDGPNRKNKIRHICPRCGDYAWTKPGVDLFGTHTCGSHHEHNGKAEEPGPVPERGVIQKWFREMCLKYHPDRGGNTKVMQALNDAHDRLKELCGVP